jgi:hypothetical protein
MSRVVATCGLVCLLAACAQVREPTDPGGSVSTAAESGSPSTPPANSPSSVMATPQMQTLQRRMSRSSTDLREEPLSNGVRKVDLHGRFLHATVLEHRTSGAQRHVCVDHPSAMAELF